MVVKNLTFCLFHLLVTFCFSALSPLFPLEMFFLIVRVCVVCNERKELLYTLSCLRSGTACPAPPAPGLEVAFMAVEPACQKTAAGWELNKVPCWSSSCAGTPCPHPHCLMCTSDSAQDCGLGLASWPGEAPCFFPSGLRGRSACRALPRRQVSFWHVQEWGLQVRRGGRLDFLSWRPFLSRKHALPGGRTRPSKCPWL